MKRFTLILFLLPLFCFSQPSRDYARQFNDARELLYYGKFREALPILLKLDSIEKDHANLNYLIGVCYVATSENLEEGIRRLEFSSAKISTFYHSGQASEKNAPIYNWYYLGVGYSFIAECEKAEACFKNFRGYISDPGDSYVEDTKKKYASCQQLRDSVMQALREKEKREEQVPKVADHSSPASGLVDYVELRSVETKVESVAVENTSLKKEMIRAAARQNLATRRVVYSTRSPLYGVQIGAFDKLLPSNDFKGIRNVSSFIDKTGKVRYVVGHCVLRSQAENLRKAVKEAGYSDAFIVDINHEEKFVQEVIHKDLKAAGKKEYRVQLGAFRKEIPEDLAKIYLKIDGVKESQEGDLTVLTSGSFKDHAKAKAYRDEMLSKGVPGAFVVVFINGKRQTPESASLY